MEPLSILLVEDDELDAMLVRRLLARGLESPKITWRPTLADAQKSVETEAVDVVLLDLHLPDSTDDETIVALRRHSPDVPIVVLSGTEDDHLVERMVRRGAEDYIPKSELDARSLRRGIYRAIELRAMRRRARLQRDEARRLERLISGNTRLHILGSVASGIANELASPAAYALLNLQLAARELESRPDENPSLVESVHDALEGVERVVRLARDLHPFSHVNDRTVELVSVDQLYRSARVVLSGRFRQSIELVESLEATPTIAGMRGRLVHLMITVLSSVLDAFSSMETDSPSLAISTHAEGEQVRLRIIENSDSLEPGTHTDENQEVLGLALNIAVCKEIAAAHGGTAELSINPDGRGQFDLVLPLETQLKVPAINGPSSIDDNPLQLLVIDDEERMHTDLERALEDTFNVISVRSTQDAMVAIGERTPDAVMLDLGSGNIDGAGFWDRISAEHPDLLAHTVFLSGGVVSPRTMEFCERDDVLVLSRLTDVNAIAATLFDLVGTESRKERSPLA